MEMSITTGNEELPAGSLSAQLDTIYQKIIGEGR
jgi:hypothetical protein